MTSSKGRKCKISSSNHTQLSILIFERNIDVTDTKYCLSQFRDIILTIIRVIRSDPNRRYDFLCVARSAEGPRNSFEDFSRILAEDRSWVLRVICNDSSWRESVDGEQNRNRCSEKRGAGQRRDEYESFAAFFFFFGQKRRKLREQIKARSTSVEGKPCLYPWNRVRVTCVYVRARVLSGCIMTRKLLLFSCPTFSHR